MFKKSRGYRRVGNKDKRSLRQQKFKKRYNDQQRKQKGKLGYRPPLVEHFKDADTPWQYQLWRVIFLLSMLASSVATETSHVANSPKPRKKASKSSNKKMSDESCAPKNSPPSSKPARNATCHTFFLWNAAERKMCNLLVNHPKIQVRRFDNTTALKRDTGINYVGGGVLLSPSKDCALEVHIPKNPNATDVRKMPHISANDIKLTNFSKQITGYHELMGHARVAMINGEILKGSCSSVPYTSEAEMNEFVAAQDEFIAKAMELVKAGRRNSELLKKKTNLSQELNENFKNVTGLPQYTSVKLMRLGKQLKLSKEEVVPFQKKFAKFRPASLSKLNNREDYKHFPRFNYSLFFDVQEGGYCSVVTPKKPEQAVDLAIFSVLLAYDNEQRRAKKLCGKDDVCYFGKIDKEFMAYLLQYMPEKIISGISPKMGKIVKRYQDQSFFDDNHADEKQNLNCRV